MSLAERNWKYNFKDGNFGVGGNFFQKIKHISANYTYDPGDGLLMVDTTAGAITITLPPIASWPVDDYRIIIPIMHVVGTNGIVVQLSGLETFSLGNASFDLPAIPNSFDFYVINSASLTMYGILSELTLSARTSYSGTWANTAWAALAIVPFATELDNTQQEVFLYQNYLTGAIADVADIGDGTILLGDGAHGLIAGDEITIVSTTSYNGDYSVVAVPDTDHFIITETFVADETGSWTRPARYTVLYADLYNIGFSAQIDSTEGAAWDATASLYADGIIIPNTSFTVSGLAGENKSMNLSPIGVALTAGQYIDLRIDNNTLTGNLTAAVLEISTKAL